MILGLVWAAAIVGGLAAVVQIVRPGRLDLRPLIFGCLALVVLLGLMGLGWQGTEALRLWAQRHPDPAALDAHGAVLQSLLGATGLGAVEVALLGGIAVWVQAVSARRRAAKATPPPAA